jgi:hypothetical protein
MMIVWFHRLNRRTASNCPRCTLVQSGMVANVSSCFDSGDVDPEPDPLHVIKLFHAVAAHSVGARSEEGCRVKVQTDPNRWGFKPKMLLISVLCVGMAIFMFVTDIFAYHVPWGLLFLFAAAITPFAPIRREGVRYK